MLKGTKKAAANPTVASLSDEDIDFLIASHWREIRGLMKELKRRKTDGTD